MRERPYIFHPFFILLSADPDEYEFDFELDFEFDFEYEYEFDSDFDFEYEYELDRMGPPESPNRSLLNRRVNCRRRFTRGAALALHATVDEQ